MYYLILILLFFFLSCSKEKDLVDVDYYMKQGKEISLINKFDFKEIKKINSLQLSKPLLVNDWYSIKINEKNNLPRFLIDDFKKKNSIHIDIKSFLVIKNNIYVIDKNSNLIILNENLKILKKNSIYKKKEFEDYNLNFSMNSNGKLIYISDNLGNIHALDINTLKILWSVKLGVPIISNLYFYNDDLFFINTNSKLYSIKSSTGEINWSHETASKMSKEKYHISISNNLLITNSDYGEFYCYDLLKKNIIWKLSLKDREYEIQLKNFRSSYPVSVDNVLYLSSNFGETIAIEETSGKIIWKTLIASTNLPIINNNYVFIINNNGYFYILNKKDGDVIFSRNLNKFNLEKNKNKTIYYDMILGNDYIYFLNSSKNLIKLHINNLNLVKIENYTLKNPKNYFVFSNHLYILEENALSKFYN